MRVSEYFDLNKTQPHLDFVDVTLDTDVPVFVDPLAIKNIDSDRSQIYISHLQSFFSEVLKYLQQGNEYKGVRLLSSLSERNEFHLGYSTGKSRGHAFGDKTAKRVWDAFTHSDAAQTGLLSDLEDSILFIQGIGVDMISDAVCNILRGPLIIYTQNMCKTYGIETTPDIEAGPVWDTNKKEWNHDLLVDLPMTNYGKVILVPKNIVRFECTFNADKYYRHYLLPVIQREHYHTNSSLVRVLKDGTVKPPYKSTLYEILGMDKNAIEKESIERPEVFERYKEDKLKESAPAMSHNQLAELEDTPPPDWNGLKKRLEQIPTGKADAKAYEDCIEDILTAVFYPDLTYPTKQSRLHGGLKIVDIDYLNESKKGLFSWLSTHYPCAKLFIECKNYGKEIKNPEVDQLAGRFSDSRGRIGILVCRSIDDKETLIKRCLAAMHDSKNYILFLDDMMIKELIDEKIENPKSSRYEILAHQFHNLIDN